MPASLLTVTPLTASGISHVFDNIPYGPKFWVDASKIAGIVSGTSLSVWTDVSGNGSHATQGSAASQPVFVTNIQNGLSAVSFSGTTVQFLRAALSGTTIAQPITVCILGAVGATNFTTLIDSTNGANAVTVFRGGATSYAINAGTSLSALTSANTSFHAHIGILNGSTSTYRVDGSVLTTGNAGTNALEGITLGQSRGLSAPALAGFIGEVMVYNRAFTDAEVALVETYFRSKWGTP